VCGHGNKRGLTFDLVQRVENRARRYGTFLDDWEAFRTAKLGNVRRCMWPTTSRTATRRGLWSQEMLQTHTAALSEEEKPLILHDNVAELYGLQ